MAETADFARPVLETEPGLPVPAVLCIPKNAAAGKKQPAVLLADELGKRSIAEGVETREQLDFLRSSGCDSVQGFFYSEALRRDEFIAFVEKHDFHTQRRKALEVL